MNVKNGNNAEEPLTQLNELGKEILLENKDITDEVVVLVEKFQPIYDELKGNKEADETYNKVSDHVNKLMK